MPAKKSDKRRQSDQFGIRFRPAERAYLEEAAKKLSEQSPANVGLGPFLIWAAKQEAEKLVGVSFPEYEAKRGKGGGR